MLVSYPLDIKRKKNESDRLKTGNDWIGLNRLSVFVLTYLRRGLIGQMGRMVWAGHLSRVKLN